MKAQINQQPEFTLPARHKQTSTLTWQCQVRSIKRVIVSMLNGEWKGVNREDLVKCLCERPGWGGGISKRKQNKTKKEKDGKFKSQIKIHSCAIHPEEGRKRATVREDQWSNGHKSLMVMSGMRGKGEGMRGTSVPCCLGFNCQPKARESGPLSFSKPTPRGQPSSNEPCGTSFAMEALRIPI